MAKVIISMDEYEELKKYKKAIEPDKLVSIIHTQYIGGSAWGTMVQTKDEIIKEAVKHKEEEIGHLERYKSFVNSFDIIKTRFEKWNES